MNFLTAVIEDKKQEVARKKRLLSLSKMRKLTLARRFSRRSFAQALLRKSVGLIAEIKLKSPSQGTLTNAGLRELVALYAKSEASAISVLTDEKYFNGSLAYLAKARRLCPQPVLRKDFIIDSYQVYESALAGADAVLLIVAALSPKRLGKLLALVEELGMEALVEVHSKRELLIATRAGAKIIGMNNRNLKTLKIDLRTTEKLMRFAKKGRIYVSESGIGARDDVRRMKRAGVNAVLVGSAIVMARDPEAVIRELSIR